MTLTERIVNTTVKAITGVICHIDASSLRLVPPKGPLLLATNHVNFLEVPIVYTQLQPRPVTGYAKAETWDSRIMAMLFDLWQAIPIQRGKPDVKALRQGLAVLSEGKILAVAPEGTRSGDGRLRQGHPGIVLLALRSGAPILPVVCFGGEDFWGNFKRLRRTDFHVAVGRPFHLRAPDIPLTRDIRREMVDEIMYQLASLLPPEYRGMYANLEHASDHFLEFSPDRGSHLPS